MCVLLKTWKKFGKNEWQPCFLSKVGGIISNKIETNSTNKV